MIYELLSANIKDVYQVSVFFKGYKVAQEIKEKYKDYDYMTIKIDEGENKQPLTVLKCYHNGSVELLFLKKIVMAYLPDLYRMELLTFQNSDSIQDYDYNDYCIIKPISKLPDISYLYDINIIDLAVRYEGDLRYLQKEFSEDNNVYFGYEKNNQEFNGKEYTFVFLIHPNISSVNHFVDIFKNYEHKRNAIQYQKYNIARNVKEVNLLNEIPKKDLVDIVIVMKNYDTKKIQKIKDNINDFLDISILIRDYIPYIFVEIVMPNTYELEEMKKVVVEIGEENIIKIIYTDFIKQDKKIYIYPEDKNKPLTQEQIDRIIANEVIH